jgi:ubiquinone/menaquinone biosynthesis C-methylase UbiE
LRDLSRINRWFGGVATTEALIERVVKATGTKHLSLLEVAAGHGQGLKIIAPRFAKRGIALEVTFLDRAHTHLPREDHGVVADALALPFPDCAFDAISCSLFAHHLDPPQIASFVKEALRVCKRAVLINDLVRHPLHLALVYAGFPLMRSPVSRFDGVASVRKAYVPDEIREIISTAFLPDSAPKVEIFRHYLFRMGVVIWKQ